MFLFPFLCLTSFCQMRQELLKKIAREAHPDGRVIIKVNHLTDPAILGKESERTALRLGRSQRDRGAREEISLLFTDALVVAADAGAKVELIVRERERATRQRQTEQQTGTETDRDRDRPQTET